MKRVIPSVLMLLSACDSAPAAHSVSVPFNPLEIAWFGLPGHNTVRGSAVMRTVGGDVRTCAGLDANLIPDSVYARARFQEMYGNTERGLLSARSGFAFDATDPAYVRASRTVTCDPQGFFTFSDLPDGSYFVTAKVIWGVRNRYFTEWQGGYLMQHVRVSGGGVTSIVLSG